jgi:Uncharacterized conserved protein, contains double-stranded beta-helix domain
MTDDARGSGGPAKAPVLNIQSLPADFVDGESPSMTTLYLGMAGGSKRLYANIDKVMPGKKSCKFHSHSQQEEFFLVLSGTGTLRIGEESRAIKAGDFFCKPAGQGIAHQFINDSKDVLEILDVGAPDVEDIIEYPDENIIYEKQARRVTRDGQPVTDWTSDPNKQ